MLATVKGLVVLSSQYKGHVRATFPNSISSATGFHPTSSSVLISRLTQSWS